jgi:predicted transposase/invertase (TIGR01784 family)
MNEKYINFFTDFGFKKLFGSEPNKDLLIDFLNELLKGREKPIKTLTFKRTEHLGASEVDRKAIFDLYCESEGGEKFIVELQKAKQKYFKDRSLFYATFPIQEQAQRGDWDFRLKAVYTIGILDFVFDEDKDTDQYLYDVKLTEQETGAVFCDKLNFIYIEMPKFNKTEEDLETHFDKWLFAIKNLYRLDSIPGKLREKVFERFFEIAEIASMNPEERFNYESSLKYYRDMKNVIDTAKGEGWEEGVEQGIQQGMQQGRQEEAAHTLLKILAKRFGDVDSSIRSQIKTADCNQLERWIDISLDAPNVEAVFLRPKGDKQSESLVKLVACSMRDEGRDQDVRIKNQFHEILSNTSWSV